MLEIKNLKKYFSIRETSLLLNIFSEPKNYIKAIDGVSFSIDRGETIGLVGESGCGKTTLGRTVLRLLEPSEGEVLFNNKNIFEFDYTDIKTFRRKVQIIFQDPFSSLNPRMKISSIVTEGLKIHSLVNKNQLHKKAIELMEIVGLSEEHLDRYPHEFSGGQRQRIGIARAISLQPEFIVCDEPVSSLDVSVQSQIINLLIDLQEKFNLGYIFISHDLGVVRYLSHKIAVMYLGKLVEFTQTDELFNYPVHPYTRLLLSSLPEYHREKTEDIEFVQEKTGYSGCLFYSRCPEAKPECIEITPELKEIKGGHKVACLNI